MGYQRLSIPAEGYALLANPFVQVGSDDPYPINGMFSDDATKSNAGNNGGLGDNLQIWDAAQQGYTTYFFSARAENKWATGAKPRDPVTDSFELGDGYWYLNRGTSPFQITVSGQVSTNEVTVTLVPGYTLVCNPFPVDLPLNNDDINWAAAGAKDGNNGGLGDNIQIWDVETQGYTTYFFSTRAAKKWATGAAPRDPTDKAIPAGQGFWYLNRTDANITITLKSPLAD